MSRPYEIVCYDPMHKGQIAALQVHLWTRDAQLAVRQLEWKYEQNPYLREPLIYLAFSRGELVGMRGFHGAAWEAGPSRECSVVPVATDLVVAPAHRNRGVVTLLMRAAFEDLARQGYQYVFNLSGTAVTAVGSLAMGWKSAGPLGPIARLRGARRFEQARAVMQRTRFLWRFAQSALLLSPRERMPFRLLDRIARRQRARPVTIEREPRLDAMSELVERLGHDGRIRQRRDREYFAWRFRSPLARYRFLYCGGDRLEGYLVLSCEHAGIRRAGIVRLVDLEAANPAVRAELLEAAIDLGRFPALLAWEAALTADARRHLADRGFVPVNLAQRVPGLPCLLVKRISPEPDASPWMLGGRRLTDLADWDLRMLAATVT